MSSPKQTCYWEISNSGTIEIDFCELEGMTEEQVGNWFQESVDFKVGDQVGYDTSLNWDKKEVMKQLREYEKKNGFGGDDET